MTQTDTIENHHDTDSNQTDEHSTIPVRMSITLPPLLHQLVIETAREADRSAASLIREAIKSYLFRDIANKAPLPRARKSIYSYNTISSNPMDREDMDEDDGEGNVLANESNRAPARGVDHNLDFKRWPITGYPLSDDDTGVSIPGPMQRLINDGLVSGEPRMLTPEQMAEAKRIDKLRQSVDDTTPEHGKGAGGLVWPAGPLEHFSDSTRLQALSAALMAYPGVDAQAIIGRLHERLTATPKQNYTIVELARFFADDQRNDAQLISETAHARAVSMENLRQTYLDGPWQWAPDHPGIDGGKSWSFVQWCAAVKRGEVEL